MDWNDYEVDGQLSRPVQILDFEDSTQITIPPNCCIHHLNGIKDDNRIENLCMMTHAGHTIFHHTGSKRSNETRQKISERKKNL